MPVQKKAPFITLSLTAALLMMAGSTGCGMKDKQNNSQKSANNYDMKTKDMSGNTQYGMKSGSLATDMRWGWNGMDDAYDNNVYVHNFNQLSENEYVANRIVTRMPGSIQSAQVWLTPNKDTAYVSVILKQPNDNYRNTNNNTNGYSTIIYSNGNTCYCYPSSTKNTKLYHQYDTKAVPNNMNNLFNTKKQCQIPLNVRDKIADQVKEFVPSVNKVYISCNDQFLSRMKNYVNDMKTGKPMQHTVNEIKYMLDQMFPQR